MNRKVLALAAITSLGLAGGLAHAGDWRYDRYDDDGPRYGRNDGRDYGRDVDYARVLEVTPIVERVRYGEPVRECYDVERYESRPDRAGATIAGGLLGAVIGHQFGSGSGRRAATVAGAVIGGAIGNDAAARGEARDDYYGRDRVRYGQECRVREQPRVEERIRGYRVAYRYHGRDYVAELPYDPGPRLRVAVDARPL